MTIITLREAINQDKLDQFIAEHKGEVGDSEDFKRVLASMAGKSKSVQGTSSQDDSDD